MTSQRIVDVVVAKCIVEDEDRKWSFLLSIEPIRMSSLDLLLVVEEDEAVVEEVEPVEPDEPVEEVVSPDGESGSLMDSLIDLIVINSPKCSP